MLFVYLNYPPWLLTWYLQTKAASSYSSGQDGRISTKLMVVRLLNTQTSESNTWWQSGRRVSDAGPTCYRTAAVSSQANNSTLVTSSVLHPSFPVLCRLPSTLKRDLSLTDRVFRRSAPSPCCCERCGRVRVSVWRADRAAAPNETRDAQKQRYTHPLPVTHGSRSRPFRPFLWDIFSTNK